MKRYIRCIGCNRDEVLDYADSLKEKNKDVKVLFVECEATYYIEVIR